MGCDSNCDIWIGVLFMITYLDTGSGFTRYSTAYLQDSCTCSAIDHLRCEPFTLDPQPVGAGNVALARTPRFFKDFFCEFTIQAPSHNHRVMLTVNHISIPKTKGCKSGTLKIYDGVLGEKQVQLASLCGAEVPKFSYRSNTDRVTLAYHQALTIRNVEKSFNLTFTYFRVTEKHTPCNTSREFGCQNGLCVYRSLECDSWNNCGDGTDESMDYHVCGRLLTTSDPMVGLAVGVTVASLLVIVMATLIAYGVQKRKGPFFHDGTRMTAVHTSDENGNTESHSRRSHILAENDTSVPLTSLSSSRGDPASLDPGPSQADPVRTRLGPSQVHIHSNPHLVHHATDDTHSIASSGEYALGLHRDPPPPSYQDLFPE